MSWYELLLVLHVFAAIIWLGAGFLLAVLVLGAETAGDREREAGYHRDVEWLTPRLFIPSSLAVLVLGILLVIDGPWGFDQLWVTLGMVGWIASFLVGVLYFKPQAERIAALTAEHGAESPEVTARLGRVTVIERLELAVLFLVAADMLVKPTGDDTGVLVGGAVILAVGGAWAASAFRRVAAAPAAATASETGP